MNTNKISETIKSLGKNTQSLFAAAIIVALSSCTKPVNSGVANGFLDSLSTLNKEKYGLLLQSTDSLLDDSVISDIVSVCSGNDSLSAQVLLQSHVKLDTLLKSNPHWINHFYALGTVNDIEDVLYPNLYDNPELLNFVYDHVGASDRDIKNEILLKLIHQYNKNSMYQKSPEKTQ